MKTILKTIQGLKQMLFAAITLLAGISLAGCEMETPAFEYGTAKVSIEQESATDSGFTVTITPSENAVSFYYSVGFAGDADLFESTELDTVMINGNSPKTIVVEGLEEKTEYAVFAKAYDEKGVAGSTAMYLVSTEDGSFNIQLQYLGDDNAGVVVNYSSAIYSSLEYYLGEPEDYDAFVKGELETNVFESSISGSTVLNFLSGLEPDHDYVFYCKGYGLKGEISVRTLDISTCAEGECADVSFEYENDVYKGLYTVNANADCAYMDVLFSKAGQYLDPSADIVGSMSVWSSIGFEAKRVTDKQYTIEHVTSSLKCGQALELWVVCYNEDDEAACVRHYEVSTPEYDENAPSATVKIEVSDITESGATYTYTPDENADFFLYETIDGEWYDRQIAQNPDFDLWEYFDINVDIAYIIAYTKELENGTFTWTETTGESGHKYYAVALPMNRNGHEGRQQPVLVPYNTL